MSDTTSTRYVDQAGVYLCKVKKPGNGWFGEAGEKSTPFIQIPCFVMEDGDQDGREIVWRGWLSDAAFDRTIEAIAKAFPGWNGDLAALENGSFSFEGSECEIVAESEMYDGKPRVKAKWLNAVGGGGGKAMDKEKVSSLISRLGRKSQAIAKKARDGQPSAPAKNTPTPSHHKSETPAEQEDNIPY